MTDDDVRGELVATLRDELAGWPIGSGYYGTTVGIDEAQEMADALLAPGGVVDRIAGKRAAGELRAAAAEARRFVVWPYGYDLAAKLDDRADALDTAS